MSGQLMIGDPTRALPRVDARPTWHRSSLVGYAICAMFFGGFGTWAAVAPLGSGIIAMGELRVSTEIKTVQHPTGGIIADILVNEGEHVKEGQVLVRLDPTRSNVESGLLRNQYLASLTQRARLLAERDGLKDIIFPPQVIEAAKTDAEVAAMIANQRDVFRSRKESLAGQIEIFNERIRQTNTEISGLRTRNRYFAVQLSKIKEEIEAIKPLVESGLVIRPRLLSLERSEASIAGEIGSNEAAIARSQQRIGEIKLTVDDLNQRIYNEVVTELRQLEVNINDLEQRAVLVRDNTRRLDIVAPRSGRVQDLAVHTVGGVINPSQPIMSIAPDDEEFVVVAEVKPRDIDNVDPNAPVTVRLTAFSQRFQHPLQGHLLSVSEDKTSKPGYPPHMQFYRALIKLDPESVKKQLHGQRLVAGMPATVLLGVGERTLLEYWTFPLVQSVEMALREP